jgi:PAS domain-containing protein
MKATAARRRSTRPLRDILTTPATRMLLAVPDLLFLMTRDGVYLDYYARDRRKLFRPPKAFLGKNIRDVMPPDHAAELVRAFARVKPAGPPIDVVYTLPIANEVRHFEARLVAGGNGRIVKIVRDITDQKGAEARSGAASAPFARATVGSGSSRDVSSPRRSRNAAGWRGSSTTTSARIWRCYRSD